MEDYSKRLRISIEGESDRKFFSKSGQLIAIGYERVVLGGRGPYVEFVDSQLIKELYFVPKDQKWRLGNLNCFYIELRIRNSEEIKVYLQKKTVDYADYLVGKFYISPFELYDDQGLVLIEKIK